MVNLIDTAVKKKTRWEISDDTVRVWQFKKGQKHGLSEEFKASNEAFREHLRAHRLAFSEPGSNSRQHGTMAAHIRAARDAWQLATGVTKPSLGPKLRPEPSPREIGAQWAAMGYGWYGHP